ncbi:VOC family protein [Leptodesmis sp.]|uniref:VOC family protein n=1 Tax=Leptodesmis sp. TaxID=3100501 RepID=UPI0040534FCF
MALNCAGALVTLAAQQFDGLVEFYCNLLGQPPAVWMPNQYAEFELPGVRLGIFQPKEKEERSEIQNSKFKIQNFPIGMALCLEVENLEAAIAHLTDLGYPPPGKILTASHGREIYAYDPEGNWLILHKKGAPGTP